MEENMKNSCLYCGSMRIVKNGSKYGKQRYMCKDCKKSFCLVDGRIKRDIKEKELCLLLHNYNLSLRSIQNIIEKLFNTKISFSLIQKWIKSLNELLKFDSNKSDYIYKESKSSRKTRKIEVLDINNFQNYINDLNDNQDITQEYCLVLIGNNVHLLKLDNKNTA